MNETTNPNLPLTVKDLMKILKTLSPSEVVFVQDSNGDIAPLGQVMFETELHEPVLVPFEG